MAGIIKAHSIKINNHRQLDNCLYGPVNRINILYSSKFSVNAMGSESNLEEIWVLLACRRPEAASAVIILAKIAVWRKKISFLCTVLSEPLFCNLRMLPHVYFYSYLYLILIFKGTFSGTHLILLLTRFPSGVTLVLCTGHQDNALEAVGLSPSICLELQEFTSSFWSRFPSAFLQEKIMHAADSAEREASLRE